MLFTAHPISSLFLFPSILTVFLSREWKHLTNENVVNRQKRRQSWFRPSGTIKKVRARLSIWLPLPKYETILQFNHIFNLFLSVYSLLPHSPWAGPTDSRNLPWKKGSFYQQWSWTVSRITRLPTPSRIQQESSSPTLPAERWGLPLQLRTPLPHDRGGDVPFYLIRSESV